MKSVLLGMAIVVSATFASGYQVQAYNAFDSACQKGGASSVCSAKGDNAQSLVQKVVNALLWFVSAASVIAIVVGGIRYVTSNGDEGRIKTAKNTILYAVIGLAVAILGQAIVLLVTNFFA